MPPLPAADVNVISGVLQGIAAVGDRIGLGWATNVLALLITLGGIGGLIAFDQRLTAIIIRFFTSAGARFHGVAPGLRVMVWRYSK